MALLATVEEKRRLLGDRVALRDLQCEMIVSIQSTAAVLAADQTRRESLTSYNNNNQSCLISPVRSEEGGGSCTWRSERLCRRVPTVRTVPVFSPWCSNRGEAGHLTRLPVDSNI